MQSFLEANANLVNARAQLFNQALQSSNVVNEQALEATFEAQNAALIEAQAQRVQVLGQEAYQGPLPLPPALVMPDGLTSKMQAFLVLRDKLLRLEINLRNQNLSMSATAQLTALQQWQQQNAALFSQLQTLGKR